jgi:hypothetical protein
MLEEVQRGICGCGGVKSPCGVTVWWETLEHWQAWQARAQVRQSFCMPGHMKCCAISFTVALVHGATDRAQIETFGVVMELECTAEVF